MGRQSERCVPKLSWLYLKWPPLFGPLGALFWMVVNVQNFWAYLLWVRQCPTFPCSLTPTYTQEMDWKLATE